MPHYTLYALTRRHCCFSKHNVWQYATLNLRESRTISVMQSTFNLGHAIYFQSWSCNLLSISVNHSWSRWCTLNLGDTLSLALGVTLALANNRMSCPQECATEWRWASLMTVWSSHLHTWSTQLYRSHGLKTELTSSSGVDHTILIPFHTSSDSSGIWLLVYIIFNEFWNLGWTCLHLSWTCLHLSWTCLNLGWTCLHLSSRRWAIHRSRRLQSTAAVGLTTQLLVLRHSCWSYDTGHEHSIRT